MQASKDAEPEFESWDWELRFSQTLFFLLRLPKTRCVSFVSNGNSMKKKGRGFWGCLCRLVVRGRASGHWWWSDITSYVSFRRWRLRLFWLLASTNRQNNFTETSKFPTRGESRDCFPFFCDWLRCSHPRGFPGCNQVLHGSPTLLTCIRACVRAGIGGWNSSHLQRRRSGRSWRSSLRTRSPPLATWWETLKCF